MSQICGTRPGAFVFTWGCPLLVHGDACRRDHCDLFWTAGYPAGLSVASIGAKRRAVVRPGRGPLVFRFSRNSLLVPLAPRRRGAPPSSSPGLFVRPGHALFRLPYSIVSPCYMGHREKSSTSSAAYHPLAANTLCSRAARSSGVIVR